MAFELAKNREKEKVMPDFNQIRRIVNPLLSWYDQQKRILPWREDPTAYHVWISEIMLQQTRVSAVIDYYHRFIQELPSISSLALCEEQRLLKLWEGLGYYSRARNLQKAAKILLEENGGEMPEDYERILSLPGIGEYTAGAICSIAFQKPYAAVDGNVLRVLARILEWDEDILPASSKKKAKRKLEAMLPKRVGDFNQALMELGALICLPNARPKCNDCPLRSLCLGHMHHTADLLPVKGKKKARKEEERTVLLMVCNDKVALQRRPEKGLLAGMWEFPSLTGYHSYAAIAKWILQYKMKASLIEYWKDAKHVFTHIQWNMKGYICRISHLSGEFCWVTKEELRKEYPLPAAFRAFSSLDFLG